MSISLMVFSHSALHLIDDDSLKSQIWLKLPLIFNCYSIPSGGLRGESDLEGKNCILGIATDGNSEVELPPINLRLRRSAFTSPVELLLI